MPLWRLFCVTLLVPTHRRTCLIHCVFVCRRKWLDPKTVAIVNDTAVYHWSMDGNAAPKKIFDRAAYDGQVQIINYSASVDKQWLILNGIAAGKTGGVDGVLQVNLVASARDRLPE